MTKRMNVLNAVDEFFTPDIRLYADNEGLVHGYKVLTNNGVRFSSYLMDYKGKSVDEIESNCPDVCFEIIDFERE